ncbi:hypothetical protein [Peribacillus asahii]|uniref:Uncharacterized protein n=1 Tax=Peribacillus asahii TaxID=228899 RepID=A0A3Q9RNX2_9BACI|nr:hypothetical protein [Peribacillus asahii]AZV43022.1 hypothetical protein BAOM_2413 [Peribacillus asahii]USK83151.1 hypothetical protein LIT35_11575 [Peribacillus asahii]
MKNRTLLDKYFDLSPDFLDTSKWAAVLEDRLSDNHKFLFQKRKVAVDMYINGEHSLKEIYKCTGVSKTELYRLVDRCFMLDENNEIYGYRALIPNKRIKPYKREKTSDGNIISDESNFSGAFNKLLEDYPQLKTTIETYYLRRNIDITEPIIKVKYLHREFLKTCRSLGIRAEAGEYPFNTSDQGKRALYRYINNFRMKNMSSIIKDQGNDATTMHHTTGKGQKTENIIRPFQRVEFDGHKIDAAMTIKFISPEGDIILREMSRIWLLMIVDVATRTILGYHICLNKEYSQYDVLNCIENAIKPWKPKEFVITGLKYPKHGGFPSEVIAETKYAVWDEIAFDNAKANLAKQVEEKLKRMIGCSINIGPVATPTRRPIIEKMFHLLEANGFQRIISTTGNNPKDPRRQNPEQKAKKYEITYEEIMDLAEVLIFEQNGTAQSGIYHLTPLELMQQRLEKGVYPRIISENISFSTIQIERVISGDLKKGRRPYIYYEGVKYRNNVLSDSYHLVKTKLTLLVDTKDLRTVKAFLPDGSELGILIAQGKWSLQPHTLQTRKQINKLRNTGELYLSDYEDPIEVFHKHLKTKAITNKSSRNKLANLETQIKDMNDNKDKLTSQILDDSNLEFDKKAISPHNLRNLNKKRITFNQ